MPDFLFLSILESRIALKWLQNSHKIGHKVAYTLINFKSLFDELFYGGTTRIFQGVRQFYEFYIGVHIWG
jgi:hypothetical protein